MCMCVYICFSFPKNENRRKKWLQAIPAHLIDIKSTFSGICSIHFLENCFKLDPSNKKKLYEDAIPTIFIKRIPLKEIQDCGNISGSVNFNIVDNIVDKVCLLYSSLCRIKL